MGAVVDNWLRWVWPMEEPQYNPDLWPEVHACADFYQVPSFIPRVHLHAKRLISVLIYTNPLQAYGLAARFNFEQEAQLAARRSLDIAIDDVDYIGELRKIDMSALVKLKTYHSLSRDRIKRILWNGGFWGYNFVWYENIPPQSMEFGGGFGSVRERRSKIQTCCMMAPEEGLAYSMNLDKTTIRLWWVCWAGDAAAALESKPYKDVLAEGRWRRHGIGGIVMGRRCRTCGTRLSEDMDTYCMRLVEEIEKELDHVIMLFLLRNFTLLNIQLNRCSLLSRFDVQVYVLPTMIAA
jgi:hypothetical protein